MPVPRRAAALALAVPFLLAVSELPAQAAPVQYHATFRGTMTADKRSGDTYDPYDPYSGTSECDEFEVGTRSLRSCRVQWWFHNYVPGNVCTAVGDYRVTGVGTAVFTVNFQSTPSEQFVVPLEWDGAPGSGVLRGTVLYGYVGVLEITIDATDACGLRALLHPTGLDVPLQADQPVNFAGRVAYTGPFLDPR